MADLDIPRVLDVGLDLSEAQLVLALCVDEACSRQELALLGQACLDHDLPSIPRHLLDHIHRLLQLRVNVRRCRCLIRLQTDCIPFRHV